MIIARASLLYRVEFYDNPIDVHVNHVFICAEIRDDVSINQNLKRRLLFPYIRRDFSITVFDIKNLN